ncbi:hypothetical protein, partial [Bacillus coahuilensis]|uniref:hypothetical protein n=1 Tax=Bacillus coahuilensis TaxID=408580 RepID=UPI0019D3A831
MKDWMRFLAGWRFWWVGWHGFGELVLFCVRLLFFRAAVGFFVRFSPCCVHFSATCVRIADFCVHLLFSVRLRALCVRFLPRCVHFSATCVRISDFCVHLLLFRAATGSLRALFTPLRALFFCVHL